MNNVAIRREGAEADSLLGEVLHTASQEMRVILGAQRCSLQLYDAANGLIVGAKTGVTVEVEGDFGKWAGPRSRIMLWPMHDSRMVPLARGETVFLSSADNPDFEKSYEGFFFGASTVCIPLMHRGSMVGVALASVYDPFHRFNPTLVEAAQHAGAIAAVSIACAIEVRETQRLAEKQRVSFASGLADLLGKLEASPGAVRVAPVVTDPIVLGANMRPADLSAEDPAGAPAAQDFKLRSLAAGGLTSAPLTEREFEILRFMCEGFTNRQIGEELFLSVNTVKGHVQSVLFKLDVKNRSMAVLKARELGLV